MSRPLTYKGSGVIQIMSAAELNDLSLQILENLASVNGTGSIYTANASGNTLIGTFTDTNYAGNIGEGNVTVLSTIYNLFQDLSAPSGTEPPRPLYFDNTTATLQVATDNTYNLLSDSVLNYSSTYEGPGSYRLANTAPSDGGTWVSLGQLNDVYTPGTTNNVYLWKKLTSGTYSVNRPLKYNNDGSIQLLSNSEIGFITKKVRQRILDTGVGQYLFQSTTPTPGTWLDRGSVADTRPTLSPAAYDSSTAATYQGTVFTGFSGFAPANYDGVAPVNFTGGVPVYYDGVTPVDYEGTAPTTYTGPSFYEGVSGFTAFSSGVTPVQYQGADASYLGPFPTNYITDVSYEGPVTPFNFYGFGPVSYDSTAPAFFTSPTGPSFAGPPNPANFYGLVSYEGPGAPNPANFYSPVSYQGPGAPNPANFYSPVSYEGPGVPGPSFSAPNAVAYDSLAPAGLGTYYGPGTPTNYQGTVPVSYEGAGTGPVSYEGVTVGYFTGSGPSYLGFSPAYFQGPGPGTSYFGPFPQYYQGPDVGYTGPGQQLYEGPGGSFDSFYYGFGGEPFIGYFFGLSQNYQGTAPDAATFFSPGPAFLGPAPPNSDIFPYEGAGLTNYLGAGEGSPPGFSSSVAYSGTTTSFFVGTGPSGFAFFTGIGEQLFAGFTPENAYVGPGPSPINYYVGPGPAFSGFTPSYFTGSVAYTGVTPGTSYFTGSVAYSGVTPGSSYFTGFTPYSGVTPAPSYTSGGVAYEGVSGATYDGSGPMIYEGPATPSPSYLGAVLYEGPGELAYSGPAYFVGSIPSATYDGPGAPVSYGSTTGYDGLGPSNFTGFVPASFTGFGSTPYTGETPATYSGVVSTTYTGLTPANYDSGTGTNYDGQIINNDISTVTTITLWRRIA